MIGKQIVYQLTLADYQVIIQFNIIQTYKPNLCDYFVWYIGQVVIFPLSHMTTCPM
jgi:hypothetical protein